MSSKRLTSCLMNSTGTPKMFAAATIMDERHLDIGHVLAISHTPVVDIAPVHTGKSNYVIVVSLCHLHIFVTHLAIAGNDYVLQSNPSKPTACRKIDSELYLLLSVTPYRIKGSEVIGDTFELGGV